MGNSLRCCLACVLPCGALDVIRIVHLNGHVEELTGPISAGQVLKANPNHVLSKPCSQGVRRILILSPDSDLKRGSIYFLIPASSIREKKKNRNNYKKSTTITTTTTTRKKTTISKASRSEHYLAEVLSEKKSISRRNRRCGRSGVWRPHLDSICEDL
ncbi:hypothetical protein IFM89_034478 [Coptis chinensis]|uniref:Uncharacterized protein n=1 Tax=Coptis chinensis TaxID=261450 RepID=A0A835HAP3_9MAGN|nr:hypothetical protein IFM89_034478 [Coptis chinensis]